MYYVFIGNEIAIGTRESLTVLYPGSEIYELPSDYNDKVYVVRDGELVVDPDAEKAKKLADLDAQYDADKAELVKYYGEAGLMGDADLQAELQDEMADLDAEYAEARKAIEEGSDE